MKLKINDKVKVIPIDLQGRIVGIYKNYYGKRYEVRYVWDAVPKTEMFFPDELLKLQ